AIRATFEMVPAEFVFELAVLLLDRPAASGQRHQRLERRRGVQVEQVVLPVVPGQRAFAQQPTLAATLRRTDAQGDKAGGQGGFGAASPTDASPLPGRDLLREHRHGPRPSRSRPAYREIGADRDGVPQAKALQAVSSSRLEPATSQLPVFPSVPEYWRLTPTECRPCFGNPVSSRARMPRRSGITALNRSHSGLSGHGECVTKCWSAW